MLHPFKNFSCNSLLSNLNPYLSSNMLNIILLQRIVLSKEARLTGGNFQNQIK